MLGRPLRPVQAATNQCPMHVFMAPPGAWGQSSACWGTAPTDQALSSGTVPEIVMSVTCLTVGLACKVTHHIIPLLLPAKHGRQIN